ncbi:hypothetical protein GCM10011391_30160 [Pullulanibacillus camelliae]|uniref:DUF624 domain-containing protein n=1 Tax=Pullulanibacillus camelliae TaxID=1707096 RepID=A0A8J3DWC7_9BACL|nr:YesL family protein [Pullulanibacillus camelliae]GGE49301.1 hypothetical protein GCM10011391_30160 [Pullulanibacillus camelliae]
MQLGGLTGGIYRLCDWIMKFAYVNLLWLLFTIVGLGLFGIVPATASLFSVVRKWVMGETDVPVFKTFWKNYRTYFIKVNIMGLIYFIIGLVLYFDIAFFRHHTGTGATVLLVVLLMITVLYLITLMYFFPTFAHFDLSYGRYFKYTLLFGISSPVSTFIMVAGIVANYFLMNLIPGLLPFFGISGMSFVIMWAAYRTFTKIEQRKEAYRQKSTNTLKDTTES